MLTEQEPLTADVIADKLNIKKTTFYAAVRDLAIEPSRPLQGDRRNLVYPPDTMTRVRQWLVDHSQP